MSEPKDSPNRVFFLRSDSDKAKFTSWLSGHEVTDKKPLTVKVSTKKEARSSKQNRISFLWYKNLGAQTGYGEIYERCTCKLLYGIPILREDDEFNKFYELALDHLSYEDRHSSMEYVPVTSLMNTKQFAEYLNIVDREAAVAGIVLPQPKDLYWQALMKEHEH